MSKLPRPSVTSVIALLALSVALGGTAVAAGTFVTIQDGSSSATAKVSTDGKLAVGDGSGSLTVDGTVAARPASPTTFFSRSATVSGSSCTTVYAPPGGKAGIVLDLTSTSWLGAGETEFFRYFIGRPTSACSNYVTIVSTIGTQQLQYQAGLVIPAGYVLGVNLYSSTGTPSAYGDVLAHGYTVPASSAPASPTSTAVSGKGAPGQAGPNS